MMQGIAYRSYLYTMYTYSAAFYRLKNLLQQLYDDREASTLSHEVMEWITGLGRTDRLLQKEQVMNVAMTTMLEQAEEQLLRGVPLQYVTGYAWFMGLKFAVSKHVLIPRPETEELVHWIVNDHLPQGLPIDILDVGTGSGCIPIMLKKLIPAAVISTCDISPDAIAVAAANATSLEQDISFFQLDFLQPDQREQLSNFNIIVSNPPYIPISEKEKLHINVRDNEPSLALFVQDNDALVFYKALAVFGKTHLRPGGTLYCELDAGHALATADLFSEMGYADVTLKKDLNGHERMLRATLP
jgi:release factor glutamine methyltransferase